MTAKDTGGRRGSALAKWNILEQINRIDLYRPGRVLVFESTGFALYGILASCGITAPLKHGHPSLSSAADFATAVGEVLAQLRQQTKIPLPRTAVLITPAAAGELLSLPVDPRKPRPRTQMREMVRYELEEHLLRLSDAFTLGALLQGRGYLSQDQRQEAETAAGQGTHAGVSAYREYVSGEQLDECLALQERLSTLEDELITGWSPQMGDGAEEGFAWYCAGIDDGLATQWVKAFRTHGVHLDRIYPQLGVAVPLVADGPEGWLLADIRQEQFGLFQGRDGRIEALVRKPCAHGAADPEAVAAEAVRLAPPDIRHIYLSAPADTAAVFMDALKRAFMKRDIALDLVETPVTDMPGEDAACPLPVRAALGGAARHALRRSVPGLMVRIEAQEPRPPIWKSRQFWPWALLVLLAAGLAGLELYMRTQAEKNAWELDLLDAEFARRTKVIEEAQKTSSEVHRLAAELAAREADLREMERRRDVLDNVIRRRQELVPGILEALSQAVTDEVVLDRLEENDDRQGFYLEGWALRDTEGQLFGNRLNDALAPWDYKIGDLQLVRRQGRLGLEGFVVQVRLVKTAPKPGEAPAGVAKGSLSSASKKSPSPASKSSPSSAPKKSPSSASKRNPSSGGRSR